MPPPIPNLEALAARLPPRPLTRFAPSPTGYLHLGHIVNAIYVWGIARALGGRVLLRIEDHDRLRSRPEYDEALREDLEWLGFRPPSLRGFRLRRLAASAGQVGAPGPDEPRVARQSEEPEAYAAALAQLARSHHVYVCDCSRREIAASVSGTSGEVSYPGTCRTRALESSSGRGVRVEIDEGEERFVDALLGQQSQDPSGQCGDLLLRDRDGHWTYQFAVTVDDCRQKIDLVIRGADLLSSTGRQIRLARMLGRVAPPVFLHHPILLKPSGEKLSKSSGDTGVRELRAAGASPAEVIGRAAHAVGLTKMFEPITADSVELLFRQ